MKRAGSTVVTNYTSKGEKIVIFVRVYPLYTDGVLTHYLGAMEPIPSEDGGVAASIPTPVSVGVTNTTQFPAGEELISNNDNDQHTTATMTSSSSMLQVPEGSEGLEGNHTGPVGVGVHSPQEDDQGSNNNDNNAREHSPDRETSETGNEGGSDRDGGGSEGGDGESSPSAELQEYPPLGSPYANSHASKQGERRRTFTTTTTTITKTTC